VESSGGRADALLLAGCLSRVPQLGDVNARLHVAGQAYAEGLGIAFEIAFDRPSWQVSSTKMRTYGALLLT
jgi:hypothetical protein